MNLPKISVVGLGHVGSSVAFAILLKNLASELVLVGQNRNSAEGDALDFLHAGVFMNPVAIRSGDFSETKNSDIVVICVSGKAKLDKSRLDLLQSNLEIFKDIIPKISKYSQEAILLIVSNPVDILTYAALKLSGFPPKRVFGTGTTLDSGRFRAMLARKLNIHPDEIHAYILGEHGDSQFPVLSHAKIGSISITRNSSIVEETLKNTRLSAYKIIKKKGYTNYAIAMAVSAIVETVIYDKLKIFPVSTLLDNYHGQSDVCLSVPAIIGKEGIGMVLPMNFDQRELEDFNKSVKKMKRAIASVCL